MMGSIRAAAAVAATTAAMVLAGCSGDGTAAAQQANDEADVAAIQTLLEGVETAFNAGDLEQGVSVFADDAIILGQGEPNIAGIEAIRTMYTGMLQQFDIDADLATEEIEVAGDLAYERGTYTLRLTDKASGTVVADLENRHIHIFKRQPDGGWKTWRMMVNNTTPLPAAGAQGADEGD